MNDSPVLLDLFCKAGGASVGYNLAGFRVVGIDIEPQKRYPFPFILGDALSLMRDLLSGKSLTDTDGKSWKLSDFSVIHASPPCQAYSVLKNTPGVHKAEMLIGPVRDLLIESDLIYVIENVFGAMSWMKDPIMLCGKSFGLKVYRHRLFECNRLLHVDPHKRHEDSTPSAGHGGPSPKGFVSVAGHAGNVEYVRMAMGISWMTGNELSQAIPPAYTQYIGKQLLAYLSSERYEEIS